MNLSKRCVENRCRDPGAYLVDGALTSGALKFVKNRTGGVGFSAFQPMSHSDPLLNLKIIQSNSGSTISTLLHDKINPKNCQVLSLGESGFLQFFRVVSRDYGKPRNWTLLNGEA